jgi:hypothetical protein
LYYFRIARHLTEAQISFERADSCQHEMSLNPSQESRTAFALED